MKIGEIARRLGTTTRTLRFYEERGLVRPARSEAGTRHYDAADLERFRAILALVEAGMALADIEVLTRVRRESRSGDQAGERASAMLARLAEELRVRREALERLETDVTGAQAVMARCRGCHAIPGPVACGACPVAAEGARAQVLRVIWEKDDAQPFAVQSAPRVTP